MIISLKWLLAILFCFYTLYIEAQQVLLLGEVTDQFTNAPLSNVLVTIRPAGENKIVKYTQTSQDDHLAEEPSTNPRHEIR